MTGHQVLRDPIAAPPFAATDSDLDQRNAHALSDIASYLGGIERHLGVIADRLTRAPAEPAVLVTARHGVEAALRRPAPKPVHRAAAMPPALLGPSAPSAPRAAGLRQ